MGKPTQTAGPCTPAVYGRHDAWHLGALVLVAISGPSSGAVTALLPCPDPPPNPIAAEPDGRRVLSWVGVADHEVTLKAPLTGSGCREHSYGGFGRENTHTSTCMPTVDNQWPGV